jgi:hypothetical protein
VSDDPAADPVPKPNALLALHDVSAEMFDTLRAWFDVAPSVPLDLRAIDSAVTEMSDPVMVAALAMRKLQALHLLSTPGVRTTTDMIVTIVQDLDRALVQAPSMRLRVAAESTDWDAALAALAQADHDLPGPAAVDAEDPEVTRFRHLHGQLHAALVAVVEASEGQIRYFE